MAYKSLMVTVRDHAKKLEAHLTAGRDLDAEAGAFGSAEKYAERLEQEFFKIRDLANANMVSMDKYETAEKCVRRAFELYREAKAKQNS